MENPDRFRADPPPLTPEDDPRWQALLGELDPRRLPRHVAIIMDGNGRWAQERGRRRVDGHKAGLDSVRDAVAAAGESGVKALTLYAFSKENWSRPKSEVSALFRMLRWFLRQERNTFFEKEIRLRILGDLEDLPRKVQDEIRPLVAETAGHGKLTLNLALSYGGRQEIVKAVRRFAREGGDPAALSPEALEPHLDTAGLPPLDLLIRTSGECRLSNFLLWQAAYAEFVFLPIHWPEFRKLHFGQALVTFQGRQRRYGGVRTPS